MPLPPDSHRLEDDHLPTPFSADQIRAACAPGHSSVYRIERVGEVPYLRATRFVEGDDPDTAAFEMTMTDLHGVPTADPQRGAASWEALQAHASYPTDRTVLAEEDHETPAGTFRCWRYSVTGAESSTDAWFASDLPGPPVDLIESVDGVPVWRMTLVAVTPP